MSSNSPNFPPAIPEAVRIIESLYLTEAGEPQTVTRSWRERLWSWPWRPLQRTRIEIPQVPFRGGYKLANGTLVMHPETVAALRRAQEGETK